MKDAQSTYLERSSLLLTASSPEDITVLSRIPAMANQEQSKTVSISPLLKRLAYPLAAEIQVEASEIASAFALIFEDRLNVVQATALLTLLHSTRKDKDANVIAQCSQRMREAASQIERSELRKVIRGRELKQGRYRGGLV